MKVNLLLNLLEKNDMIMNHKMLIFVIILYFTII